MGIKSVPGCAGCRRRARHLTIRSSGRPRLRRARQSTPTLGGHMKRVAALILMLVGSNAHADCQDFWFEHWSRTLYLSVSYSQGCYHGELVLNFSKFSENGPRWPDPSLRLKSIPFDRECRSKKKNKDGETIEFSCRKDGVSPLAGATYRFKLIKTTIQCDGIDLPDWDHTFVCISGCGSTTPKRLAVPFGEGCA